MKSITDEIGELRGLPIPELVARYEAAFGRAPRVRHREYLWKRIAWRIQGVRPCISSRCKTARTLVKMISFASRMITVVGLKCQEVQKV